MRPRTMIARTRTVRAILGQVIDTAPYQEDAMQDLAELLIWMSVRKPRALNRALRDMRMRKERGGA